jgi:phosphoribosylformylglycinamidine cyclo-ligase/phosphoribosylamine--glycine ligase/phosphoribosylformylglycinamidine cyclo-ligase
VTLADALLAPHRSYLQVLWPLLSDPKPPVKALVHLTGGGLMENPPRVFPEGIGAVIRRGSWPDAPLFTFIQQTGEVDPQEMYRVFNMGIGMLVIVSPDDLDRTRKGIGEETWVVGELVAGDRKVTLR